MSSAQLESRPEFPSDYSDDVLGPDPTLFALQDPQALKEQVAARLAAHRARRQRKSPAPSAPTPISTPSRVRNARIAATVAERYAHSESYRSFLAAEAEAAIRQAEAAAHIAAVNALAVTAAQLDLLEELEQLPPSKPTTDPGAGAPCQAASRLTWGADSPKATEPKATPKQTPADPPKLTIRLYEEPIPTPAITRPLTSSHHAIEFVDPETEVALDAEIAFRQSPTFADPTPPAEIPANLLEFPRQLVAARRARPRLAEGPLREEEEHDPTISQLRIFEVEPTQISSAPAVESAAPEWTSIMLDAQPTVEPLRESTLVQAVDPDYFAPPTTVAHLLTAPLELRIMSAAVDTCIVLAAMLAFFGAAVLTIGAPPSLNLISHLAIKVPTGPAFLAGPIAFLAQAIPVAIVATVAFIILATLYQLLFFSFSNATPGMNYARIGLCTFKDENPTRSQMRRRALAFLLSACPLGLGLLWSWIDSDRLGWHDRLSRMYQRSY